MREITTQNAVFNKEMQAALFSEIRDIARSARRPIGIPAPLEGAKPTVDSC